MNIYEKRANAVSQLYTERKGEEVRKINKSLSGISGSNLKDIKGLGPATLKTLIENNIKTKEELKTTSLEKIKKLITNPMTLKGIYTFLKNK